MPKSSRQANLERKAAKRKKQKQQPRRFWFHAGAPGAGIASRNLAPSGVLDQ